MSEVIIVLSAYLIVKLMLDLMQIHTISTAKIDEDSSLLLGINEEDDKKSRDYNISKLKLSILKHIVNVGWIYLFLTGGFVKSINTYLLLFTSNVYYVDILSIISVFILLQISSLIFSYYSTFVIESKYEFNTATKKLFIKDSILSFILTLLIVLIMSMIFFYIVDFKNIWWMLMASTMFLMIIMSMYIYPSFISPMFNKFSNLENENIEREIKDLSEKTNFNIENLYVMDSSKRSKHPNAYFTGFKNNRRIVFYDTLINLLHPSEVKAVLAHEIGHYKLNHISKSLFLSILFIFFTMFLMSELINDSNYLEMLNLPVNESSQLLALVLTYQIVSFFIDPLFSVLSRKNEYEADDFASSQADKNFLISSLVKLYKSNLTFLAPNKIYAAFYFSHPTVLERINNLRKNNG